MASLDTASPKACQLTPASCENPSGGAWSVRTTTLPPPVARRRARETASARESPGEVKSPYLPETIPEAEAFYSPKTCGPSADAATTFMRVAPERLISASRNFDARSKGVDPSAPLADIEADVSKTTVSGGGAARRM